jgi:hypothetical protein
LKRAKNNKSNSKRKGSDGEERIYLEEEMPAKWMFNGWFVFVLFGPQGVSQQSLSCLSKDGKRVAKVSRAEARAKEAEVGERKRSTDKDDRGVSNQDRLALAALAQSEMKEAQQNIRELMFLANSEETNALSALKLTCQMLEAAEDDREKKYHKRRKIELLQKLEELEERKKLLSEESEQL